MALFQPILGNISGSIGGSTWANNKGGPYVRRRTVPTNPTTLRQTAVRSYLGTLSAMWQDLTSAQRSGWNIYAQNHPVMNRQGVSIKLSGMSWFVGLNSRLLDVGMPALSAAPTNASPSALSTCSMTVAANVATVTFTPTLPAGSRLILKMSKPGSAATWPNESTARHAGKSAANAVSGSTIALVADHPAGLTANYWVYVQDTKGRLSTGVKCRVVAS